jgi:DNA invertase Pin-like site-specific DNA recombinase
LNGGNWELVGDFTEVETSKGANAIERRPQLKAALEACKKNKAARIIAKLDRLARNVHFVSDLLESGVEFCRRRHAASEQSDDSDARGYVRMGA